ncbi:hypothetical protein MBM_00959 [Drepanopeziza brunnea f. sp. 'multigermtubi' MB_m1]|uniref:Uncharacterized protein n=1 Tax=Marssonina brunnea f. sp. multigermtubi (strain MB_m1) TaxID=1072389 RepID=K1X5A5_MARBU|nr:uncharacterized protein MBM_00959 [Drepanopeziza brunnea f. sp. 'multigermtubi' MB_m1]EKD20277.1 hypothetical protein MBM_00959 [Drepanopeziza brunnea f. sp. 'multigermtubi' MB_m1]
MSPTCEYLTPFELDIDARLNAPEAAAAAAAAPATSMGSPIEEYAYSVLFSFIGVLVFISSVMAGMWVYRLYTTRGFHLADFERLSAEAQRLAQETSTIRRDVESDSSSEPSVRIANVAKVDAADEIDAGIRIALCAWEDIMQPGEGAALDEEKGVGGGKLDSQGEGQGQGQMGEKRKSHGRYVIGLMRGKCLERVEKRRDLSPALQAMHLEVLSRNFDIRSSRISRRMASGSNISFGKSPRDKYRSLSEHPSETVGLPASHTLYLGALLMSSVQNEEICAPSTSAASAAATPGSIDPMVPSAMPLHSTSQRSASCPVPDDDKSEMMGPARKEHTCV